MTLIPSLQLKQQQKLVMTPMLQQALKILQLNNLELSDLIQQQCSENPLLEEVQAGETAKLEDSETQAADAQLTEAVRLDTSESPPPPEATVAPPPEREPEVKIGERGLELEGDWKDYFSENGTDYAAAYEPNSDDKDGFENFLTRPPSLQEYLFSQMEALEATPAQRAMMEEVIGAVDERGYFTGSLEEIASRRGASQQEAFQALMRVQTLEPVGVAARDLRECLLVQLKAANLRDSLAYTIVSDHLKEVEKRKTAGLAEALKVAHEDIAKAERIISALEPLPGRPFGGAMNSAITVDAVVEKDEDGIYVVQVLDSQLPRLAINSYYRRMLKEAGKEKDATHAYLAEKYQSAVWLIRSIQQRHKTLTRVIESIVEVQKDFLDHGLTAFRPLTLKEIAARTGLHESTVSRVTTRKYVQTPRGIFELKFFFSGGFKSGDGGEDTASVVVKEKLRSLIESEDPQAPHSDQKLAELLNKDGVQIARRTVAKYREELHLLPAHQRKK